MNNIEKHPQTNYVKVLRIKLSQVLLYD